MPEKTELGGEPGRFSDFEVPHESSHWRVALEGEVLRPPDRGSVWIPPQETRMLDMKLRARIHEEHNALPPITIRSAEEIDNPTPWPRRAFKRA